MCKLRFRRHLAFKLINSLSRNLFSLSTYSFCFCIAELWWYQRSCVIFSRHFTHQRALSTQRNVRHNHYSYCPFHSLFPGTLTKEPSRFLRLGKFNQVFQVCLFQSIVFSMILNHPWSCTVYNNYPVGVFLFYWTQIIASGRETKRVA